MDSEVEPRCRFEYGTWLAALAKANLSPKAQGALSTLSKQAWLLQLAGTCLRFAPDLKRCAGTSSFNYFTVGDPLRLKALLEQSCDTYAILSKASS